MSENGGESAKAKKKLAAGAIARHLRELMWPRRWSLAAGLLLMLTGRLAGLVLPGATKYLIDEVVGQRRADLLGPLVAVAGAAVAVQALCSFSLTQLLSKSAQRLIAELRIRVQRHVGRLPVAYYDQNKVGALVSRIMNDVEGVRNLVGTGLVELLGGLVTATGALVLLLRINQTMTLLALGLMAAFAVVLWLAFAKIRPIFRERNAITAEVTGRLSETLGGVRVVKGFRAEEREATVFASGALRLFDNVRRTLTATSLVGLASTLLMGVVGVVVMLLGGRLILAGQMTVGDFFAYTLYLGLLVAPIFQIAAIGSQITEAFAGLDRMDEVLREAPEDADPGRTHAVTTLRGEVEFEDVSFEYDRGKPVLRHASLRSDPGTMTALVGPSGSGKSTLIGLVAAFATPTSGRIRIDGTDLATVSLASYRSQLGVVLQDSFLFDGSIRDNIAFGRPQATADDVARAARIAHVDEFASRFEHGLETIVGERGVKLSGGQRQRVAIARAVLADPRILILDEATSSLDSESEAHIQAGLRALMAGRTTFVIAHRLSTIRNADQILVLDGGEIVERGTHPELLARRGRYHDLYTRQAGLEADRFVNPGEGDAVPAGDDAARGRTAAAPGAIALVTGRSGA